MWGRRKFAIVLMVAASSVHAIDAARLMPELAWEKRVLLIFAANQTDADYRRQAAILKAVDDGLIERDMVVIRAFSDQQLFVGSQSHEQAAESFYQRFAVAPDEFRVILIGKDGSIKLDRESAVSAAELFALVDSMPMRRHEMLSDG